MTTRTRTSVHQGVASYMGGTYEAGFRCWQNGPLTPYGLGTVRLAYPKNLNDRDYFNGMAAGTQTGGFMVVHLGDERENRRGRAGPPVSDGSRNITAGGIVDVEYRVSLYLYTISQCKYTEDAQANFDVLLEQVKQQVRLDRTLGGCCDQAGQNTYGIRAHQDRPFLDANNRTYIDGWVQFDLMTQIVA